MSPPHNLWNMDKGFEVCPHWGALCAVVSGVRCLWLDARWAAGPSPAGPASPEQILSTQTMGSLPSAPLWIRANR